jgi:hypothetical protein
MRAPSGMEASTSRFSGGAASLLGIGLRHPLRKRDLQLRVWNRGVADEVAVAKP